MQTPPGHLYCKNLTEHDSLSDSPRSRALSSHRREAPRDDSTGQGGNRTSLGVDHGDTDVNRVRSTTPIFREDDHFWSESSPAITKTHPTQPTREIKSSSVGVSVFASELGSDFPSLEVGEQISNVNQHNQPEQEFGTLPLHGGKQAQPIIAPPIMAEPMMAEPMMAEPMMAEPMMAEPMMAEPMMAEPMMVQAECSEVVSACQSRDESQSRPCASPGREYTAYPELHRAEAVEVEQPRYVFECNERDPTRELSQPGAPRVKSVAVRGGYEERRSPHPSAVSLECDYETYAKNLTSTSSTLPLISPSTPSDTYTSASRHSLCPPGLGQDYLDHHQFSTQNLLSQRQMDSSYSINSRELSSYRSGSFSATPGDRTSSTFNHTPIYTHSTYHQRDGVISHSQHSSPTGSPSGSPTGAPNRSPSGSPSCSPTYGHSSHGPVSHVQMERSSLNLDATLQSPQYVRAAPEEHRDTPYQQNLRLEQSAAESNAVMNEVWRPSAEPSQQPFDSADYGAEYISSSRTRYMPYDDRDRQAPSPPMHLHSHTGPPHGVPHSVPHGVPPRTGPPHGVTQAGAAMGAGQPFELNLPGQPGGKVLDSRAAVRMPPMHIGAFRSEMGGGGAAMQDLDPRGMAEMSGPGALRPRFPNELSSGLGPTDPNGSISSVRAADSCRLDAMRLVAMTPAAPESEDSRFFCKQSTPSPRDVSMASPQRPPMDHSMPQNHDGHMPGQVTGHMTGQVTGQMDGFSMRAGETQAGGSLDSASGCVMAVRQATEAADSASMCAYNLSAPGGSADRESGFTSPWNDNFGQQSQPEDSGYHFSSAYQYFIASGGDSSSKFGSGKRIGRPRIDRSNTKCEKCGTSSTPQWRYLPIAYMQPSNLQAAEPAEYPLDFSKAAKICLCNACWLRFHKNRPRRLPPAHLQHVILQQQLVQNGVSLDRRYLLPADPQTSPQQPFAASESFHNAPPQYPPAPAQRAYVQTPPQRQAPDFPHIHLDDTKHASDIQARYDHQEYCPVYPAETPREEDARHSADTLHNRNFESPHLTVYDQGGNPIAPPPTDLYPPPAYNLQYEKNFIPSEQSLSQGTA